MELIDEEGRLFGAVNVIDALVVLLVLAVVVAGVALVGPFADEGEPAVRYATVDLGEQQPFVARQITAGDEAPFEDTPGNLTVTDVYVTPAGGENVSVVVRARVRGRLVERDGGADVFTFGDDPLQPGRTLAVETLEYDTSGVVMRVDTEGNALDVGTTQVVLESTAPQQVTSRIDADDEFRIAGQRTATVESVAIYPTTDSDRVRLHLGLSLTTRSEGGDATFGGRTVRLGNRVPFRTGEYNVSGPVIRIGSTTPSGEGTTTRVMVKLDNVRPELARSIETGMTERTRGTTLARVTDKRVEPAQVVLTSEDGDIFGREHPLNKDVYLTVDLSTRRTGDGGLRFHGRPLRENAPVVLDLGRVTVSGTVIEIEG